MSPRRSSRARTTQPPGSVATAHSTSSSSTSSARGNRAGRSNDKQSSPQKSLTPHSLSSEEPEEPPRGSQIDPPLTRRRTREQDNDEDESTKLEDDLDDEIAEEDEVTRCVCGYQEYPGPPSDAGKSSSALTDDDAQGDDLGGLFIQCDICKVWQHGGCVGIMQEEASPDEYFCEECRKDLHKVTTSSKGYVSLLRPSCTRFHQISTSMTCILTSPEQSKVLPIPPRIRTTTRQAPQNIRLEGSGEIRPPR